MPRAENAYDRTLRQVKEFEQRVCPREDQSVSLSIQSDGAGQLEYSDDEMNRAPMYTFSSSEALQHFLNRTPAEQLVYAFVAGERGH